MRRKSFTAADGALLAFLALTALFSSALLQSGNTADIYVRGALYSSVSLDKDCIIELEGNALEVKDGKIRMIFSDCPNHACEKAEGNILCVPNQVSVVLRNKEELDAVVR
ncbi:MAG: NusG domain II-containing protein [Clostridia bacterium]|nr:NusG domain II-containing protein [Clostridia bacterium]